MTGFGKQLLASAHPPWADHYLRYKLLKKTIKLIRSSDEQGHVGVEAARQKLTGLQPPEGARLSKHAEGAEELSRIQLEAFFEELLSIERVRFKAFSKSQWLSMVQAEQQAVDAAAEENAADAVRLRMAVRRDCLEDRRLLLSFQDIQYVAFFKIVKKFDKVTGRALLPVIMKQLDEEIASGEFGGTARSVPAAASKSERADGDVRSQSARQIKRANKLSKRALLTQAPLLTSDERKERFDKTDLVESGGLEDLDALPQDVDMQTMTENVTHIKAEVFSGLVAEVVDGVKISDPETAAALEQLQIAHHTLFRTKMPSAGTLATPRADAGLSPAESDRASSVTDQLDGVTEADYSQRKLGCVQCAQSFARQFVPACLIWLPQYQYGKQLRKDVVAGTTLAIMGVPQGLAYASLVGISPVFGIFTVIFPPIAYGFLGHSRQGAVGPMSIPCLIIAAVVDKHAGIESTMEDRVEITMALTWMIGLIMLLAGFLRLGLLINFISKTVLTGFVHASAFMVCASMTPKLLGVSIEKSPVIYETVPRTWDVLPNAKLRSLLLSAGGIVLLLALNALKSFAKRKVSEAKEARRKKELQLHPQGDHDTHADTPQAGACCRGLNIMFTCFSPVMIFVVVMVSVGAHMCDYERLPEDSTPGTGSDSTSIEHVTTVCDDIKMVGDLPFGWPGVRWEWWERLGIDLLWDAGSISMVILAEHVSNVKLYSSVHDYEVCMSAELMSIGLTNCIGSLFSSFAVGARFSGSAVNNSVGATSQVSLLVSGFVALALMPALAPLLYFLPKPALSIVVMFAVAGVVDVSAWPRLWRVSKHDFFVMASSFGATLVLGVLSGLGAAIAVSLGIFILNSSQPRIVELGRATGSVDYRALDASDITVRPVPGAKLLRLESSLAFFNVSALTTRIATELHHLLSLDNLDKSTVWHAMVLDFSCTPWVDSTAAAELLETVRSVQNHHGYPIVLCHCNAQCMEVLLNAGMGAGAIPSRHIFHSVHDAARAIALGQVTLGDSHEKETVGADTQSSSKQQLKQPDGADNGRGADVLSPPAAP